MPQPLGLYFHIPFCLAKCTYCAFVSQAGTEELHQPYVAALCREIAAAGGDFDLSPMPVDTLFFGGGTPTVLSAASLSAILLAVKKHYSVQDDAEISIEANPGTLDRRKLEQLRSAGFNRLSIGVQSFDDRVLTAAGRIHRSVEAEQTLAMARSAGFDNISLDLMYGLPAQTLSSWEQTLKQAVSLAPEHISAYGLKVEVATPLAAALAAGAVCLPPEAEEEAMYDLLNAMLPDCNYRRYEISNYSRPGRECRHNLKYWHYRPYRGFGVAAHSFFPGQRFANTEKIQEYLQQISAGLSTETFREELDGATAMGEYAFLSLRLAEGVNAAEFFRLFGADFFQTFQTPIHELLRKRLVCRQENSLRLTAKGMKFGNQVFAEFLP